MKRQHRKYNELGRRIAALAPTQRGIAKALKVSQQTVSKKLRGECAVLVSDLEKLAKAFKVKMSYWFAER